MQDLLHEFSLAKEETKLERPLHRTPNSSSLQQEEKDKGISMMHASLDDIERDMARAKLYKQKTMSSNSETAFQPRWAHRSPRSRCKQQPSQSSMHEIAKWGKRVERMQKRRRRLFSPASPSDLPPKVPIPLLQGEDKHFSSKQGKGSTKYMHQARACSTKPGDVMAESKGREAIVTKHSTKT